jgi:ATP-binding cassette subfamily B protein
VQTSVALFRRIFEYLDLQPAIVDKPDAHELPVHIEGRIEFDDVHFRYPAPVKLHSPEPQMMRGGGGGGGGMRSLGLTGGFPGAVSGGGGGGHGSSGRVGVATFAAIDVIREEPESSDGDDDTEAEEPKLPRRDWAVDGVSLTVEPGQLAAFVGPSGAGKTTLCYLVPRLYDVNEGAVRIDGIDVRDVTMSSLADATGMVTQDPYLFHDTIRANMLYAKPEADHEEVVAAARAANIHDRIMSFAQGYDTLVGERGFRLSGGEKQRLAIARVLLKNPRILILDEATSALDTSSERLVQQALNTLMEGRTTLAIAHRLSTIQHADVIFVIDDGQVVERGTHRELLREGGLYARLHAEQFGGGTIEARCRNGVVFTDGVVLPRDNEKQRRRGA